MITATVKHNDNYADIEFPCSEAYLSAKLMEIHVDDLPYIIEISPAFLKGSDESPFHGLFPRLPAGYMAFSHLHSEIKKAEGLSK